MRSRRGSWRSVRKMIEARDQDPDRRPRDVREPEGPREDGYQIEEGAAVRLRQVIVRILPD